MRRAVPWIAVALIAVLEIVAAVLLLPFVQPAAMKFLNAFPSSGGPPIPVASADLSGSGPGSLVTATTMPGLTRTLEGRGFEAARVLYRSTSGDTGAETVVSGSVYVPKGKAPAGGWPVVAFGHGTLGIDGPCAPSLSPDLLGNLAVVRVLTKLGFAVAFPDYQGLGTKGLHPYGDSKTAGLNMIDAVRALHRTFPDISGKWAAMGHSQGGGAAWAADEQAASYAPELTLVGAATASPVTDLTGLVDNAQQGSLTSDQRPVMQGIIESLARLHPDLNRDAYRHGAAAVYWGVLTDCSSERAYARASAINKLGPNDFAPDTSEAADRLRALLQGWAMPQKPLSAPLFVWYGGHDPFIDAGWTAAAIQRACQLGGSLTVVFDPTGGHNPASADLLIDWVIDRFAGKPVANDCKTG
jgi:pimeloyl-ACP methyl ester carboxylesterase